MQFKLFQLYQMNRTKPFVGIDVTEVQWDICDLSDCPPEDLPKTFKDTEGKEHLIEDIHSMKSSL